MGFVSLCLSVNVTLPVHVVVASVQSMGLLTRVCVACCAQKQALGPLSATGSPAGSSSQLALAGQSAAAASSANARGGGGSESEGEGEAVEGAETGSEAEGSASDNELHYATHHSHHTDLPFLDAHS